MKRIAISGFIVVLALAAVSLVAADDKKASVLFQAGLAKETVQGDLQGAIALYESAVKEADANRALAAKALLRLGGCYQKLGEEKAQAVFDRVAREFADQKDAAAEARTRLASLKGVPAPNAGIVTRQVWTGPNVSISGSVSA